MTENIDIALAALAGRIAAREAVIGVVGLGYVGLPVACTFAAAGYRVVGVDVEAARVEAINASRSPIQAEEPGLSALLDEVVASGRFVATTDPAALRGADVITINVQTPVLDDHRPDYSFLDSAATSIGRNMRPGTLVVVESTVAPGTTERLVGPVLEKASGLRLHDDFFLGACPERVMPGRLLGNIRRVPRVCGGATPAVAEVMKALYETVVDAELDTTSIAVAELVKVTENAFRDVQIAFANEVAQVCADLDEDVWLVRDLVNKVPERHMHRPGGGVGGHCIPKDTWLLAASSEHPLELLPAARRVNDGIPLSIARMVEEGSRLLLDAGVDPGRARTVLVLGFSYLPDSDDTRNSPSLALVDALRAARFEVLVHDPVVPELDIDLADAARRSGVAVKMVDHSQYAGLHLDVPFVLDAQHLAVARRTLDELRSVPHV